MELLFSERESSRKPKQINKKKRDKENKQATRRMEENDVILEGLQILRRQAAFSFEVL